MEPLGPVQVRNGIALPLPLPFTMWDWVVNATPRPIYLRERLRTHCIGSWVVPRTGLAGCSKSRPPPGFDRRTVQPVE